MPSGLYGVLAATVMFVFTRLAPQPTGVIIFFSILCIQLSWVARICWRRTGLPFATAAMINGSVMAAALVVLALMGEVFPDFAPATWVLFGRWAAIGPVCLLIESRVNQEKWGQWAQHMEHQAPWHIAIGRHIPDRRKSGA